MYHHVEGLLVVLGPTRAVVETGGLGFELRIPLSTYEALKGREGARVRLLCHLQVLEDDLRLYGFSTQEERTVFQLASSVSGVGPAIALHFLASFDAAGFAGAILSGDAGSLRKVKGVGPKLSERMVLELKDHRHELQALAGNGASAGPGPVPEAIRRDVTDALEGLGYTRREAQERLEAAVAELVDRAKASGAPPDLSLEQILRGATRHRAR